MSVGLSDEMCNAGPQKPRWKQPVVYDLYFCILDYTFGGKHCHYGGEPIKAGERSNVGRTPHFRQPIIIKKDSKDHRCASYSSGALGYCPLPAPEFDL
jgi:hypothetical protein